MSGEGYDIPVTDSSMFAFGKLGMGKGFAVKRLSLRMIRAGFAPLRSDVPQGAGFAAANIPLGIGLNRQVEL